MSFDDIPEDKEEKFPCELCDGNIIRREGSDTWECDTCVRRPKTFTNKDISEGEMNKKKNLHGNHEHTCD